MFFFYINLNIVELVPNYRDSPNNFLMDSVKIFVGFIPNIKFIIQIVNVEKLINENF